MPLVAPKRLSNSTRQGPEILSISTYYFIADYYWEACGFAGMPDVNVRTSVTFTAMSENVVSGLNLLGQAIKENLRL